MGITDFFSDLYNSISFGQEAYAEAQEEDKEEGEEESGDDKKEEKEEGGSDEGGEEAGGDEEGGDGEEAEEEEEEEEEEDEPVDPKPQLEEECARSAQCVGYKHHFDECVERVTAAAEDENHKGPKEDCVEEFFHLQHCVTNCAAPKLFARLK